MCYTYAKEGEILILEITKLVKEKQGEGISVDDDYFSESCNLVFIDEGHKGQKTEERAWKNLREHLTRGEGSFTFEYSATFGQIITFKKDQERDFKDELIELLYDADVARRVTIDLRNKISIAAGGFNSQVAEDSERYRENFLKQFNSFIDYAALTLEANRYKLLKGYRNLIIKSGTLHELINGGSFNLISHKGQFDLQEAINGKIQNVAVNVVRDYINKFYADKEKAFLSKYLTYEMLDHSVHEDMFPREYRMVVKVPKKHQSIIDELGTTIKQLYEKDDKTLPSIHFDKHLYSPIASVAEGKKYKEIKTVPTRLNEGERDFIQHLREYVKESGKFDRKELFVLRNLSIKGIGFFMESSSFYPDFILWVVDGKKQYIFFLDPKGIQLGETNFKNPKVIWCKHDLPDLEKKIQTDLSKDKSDISISISAYILSITPIEKVKKVWSEGDITREEFEENKILFIEDDKNYLNVIFREL